MLATPTHHNAYHSFQPKTPSPLSPRSANIHGRQPIFSMSGESGAKDAKPQQQQNTFSFTSENPSSVPYSKRAIKKAPAVSQDALKERRRSMFLRKVREGREDRRFERHGEDIMRLDFVQRQKQWEAEQARSAPQVPSDGPEEEDEEEYGLPSSSGNAMRTSAPSTQVPWQASPEEADEVALREDEELEALLSFLPGEQITQQQQQQGYQHQGFFQPRETNQGDELMSEHFGSDEDDYDALFSDFINAEAHAAGEDCQGLSGGDEMDMS